ncbi:MAG TPA: PhoH family protein [Candidatus Cloacimonadota bacterium]|nr:PhoH family protein [Candidatus Cloacimonadota bacterium]HOF59439.1 PhoH family protein [Candidatus Cloacimonadota bacterium]HOR58589.1 PhoH family protein [Candidatus Cloacimonadota bacterium]HPB08962.1 PhoH family protein [Candidatus Cloacimonadota bacterium]HQL12722.1 PhoH family protein [Candidatus Cloacimonadota bacterium]
MTEKIFVLDTNVLIHSPQALFSFEENRVVVPIVVLEEIDQFKKGVDEKSRNARQIGRYLDSLRTQGSLQEGVRMENGGTIQVTVNKDVTDTADKLFFLDRIDNLIIGTALYFKDKYPDKQVTLISKDTNVRIKADAVGINSENYETDTIKFEELYTGWNPVEVEKSDFDEATVKGFLPNTFGEFCPNQYLRITDNQDPARSRSLRYLKSSNAFHAMQFYTGEPVFGITARNFEQEMALDLLLDDSIKLVSLSGKAGTGKTLLAMAAGLQKVVEDQKYTRLVISRPISPLGKDLGYLPGTKSEKFNPWMQPIYDNMDILLSLHEDKSYENMKNKRKPSIEDFMDYGFLELEPLTYIRGRSLPDQFIIIDEAQNLTPHEMKTIITRAGENTKLVLTGDPYQIDIPYLDSASNGLSVAVEKLKNEDIVGHMTLEKGERSKLADLAAKYF